MHITSKITHSYTYTQLNQTWLAKGTMVLSLTKLQHDTVRLHLAATSDDVQTRISQLAMFFVHMRLVDAPPRWRPLTFSVEGPLSFSLHPYRRSEARHWPNIGPTPAQHWPTLAQHRPNTGRYVREYSLCKSTEKLALAPNNKCRKPS